MMMFSGSYAPGEVNFLLKKISVADTPIEQKERLIQSGKQHYSALLSYENPPEADYLQVFYAALAANEQRLALDLLNLAQQIVKARPHGITLVSLVRAGTPIGVLLKHILKRYFQLDVAHYGVSIIRDLGLDSNALQFIIQQHAPETLVFIDGWTGKGVIANELSQSLKNFAAQCHINIPNELFVIADLAGKASHRATHEDYLIPSCLLNATISGLISRSVYNETLAAARDFHGCLYYADFAAQDLSNYFIQRILTQVEDCYRPGMTFSSSPVDQQTLQHQARHYLNELSSRYGVSKLNYIKPGIGEASRVLLRRKARLLLLKDPDAEATLPLRWLAEAKAIPIAACPNSPYLATALITEINT